MVEQEYQANYSDMNSEAEKIDELREEDATIDINFDQPTGEAEALEEAPTASNVGELMQQLATLKAELEDRTHQSMRIAADFENYRKRTSKEKEELEAQVKGNTIVNLLPVVDNFERARSQIKPQTEAEMTIHKSYQGVYKQLVEALKRLGVSAMRLEGQEFNPCSTKR